MAPHSSTLAWKIPWTEEPGGLRSLGSLSPTWLSVFTFPFHFHALEKEMATHSSVLAWRIPGMAEPGWLPSMRSHRVGHDWSDLAAAAVSDFNKQGEALNYYIVMPLWYILLGSEECLKIFSWFLVLKNLTKLWIRVVFFKFNPFEFCWDSWIYKFISSSVWR